MFFCGGVCPTRPSHKHNAHLPCSDSTRPGRGGFPEPRAQSSLPCLQLVQSGACRDRAQTGQPPFRTRLPITPPILRRMRESWTGDGDDVMLWAAALSCFFGFFRAGEITVPSATAFDPAAHLAWGDVSSDNNHHPSVIRFLSQAFKDGSVRSGSSCIRGHHRQ